MINPIAAIRAYFTAKSTVNEIIKEAKMPTASGKPGWKTSEFWMNVASQAGVLWGAVSGFVPPKYAAIITISGAAVYTIARTISKAVTDIQATKASTATVTTTEPMTTVTTPA